MDFPARPPAVKHIPDALAIGLGRPPLEVWAANDSVSLGVRPVREVTASSIRSVATQPNDTSSTLTQDHSGNR